ncbi:unnamed protein product [Parnassius apollo]|uniref:(apollo) hypothetical protein n=1 Tax=Parnassius apollo TaxID=110799 RepID=A0A8S3XTE6_PARAO|nr:unnamed protein product [Parnassius apollo]
MRQIVHLYTLVRWAKQNSPAYTAVNQDLFVNFKAWLHTKNWIKDTNSEKISWNKIREVKVQWNNPDIIEFKYDFFEENYRKLNCGLNLKLTRGRKKKAQEPKLDKLYNNPISITEVKYKDLVSLCDTMIIPKKYEYHDFYKNLKHSKEEQGDDEED